jgi:hypothetical protein
VTSTHQLGFFGKLARAVLANRAATVVFLVLTTIIAGYFTSKLHVDSDILTLMPEDEPSTKALKRLDEEEGGVNFLTIAVEAEDKEKRDAFLGDLAGRLRALPDTEYVLYELDPDTTFRIGILQLPTSDLVTIRDRLQAAIALGCSTSARSPTASAPRRCRSRSAGAIRWGAWSCVPRARRTTSHFRAATWPRSTPRSRPREPRSRSRLRTPRGDARSTA